MQPTKIILLACGSFNPPTNMHFRMFELARDYLHRLGIYQVIGGIMSPVHDAYAKKDLVSANHRCQMLEAVLQNSDWIKLSSWECSQEQWSTTRQVLEYHQNQLNSIQTSNNINELNNGDLNWLPDLSYNNNPSAIKVKLLCGADLLESFAVPGLWSTDDLDAILNNHGLVVITRENCHPEKFIYESDLLTRNLRSIIIVNEWMRNDISSTKIRRALRRSESVRYIIHDAIINYIHQHKLYGAQTNSKYVLSPSVDYIQNNQLTPTTANFVNNNALNGAERLFLKADTVTETNNRLNMTKCCPIATHPGQAVKVTPDDTTENEQKLNSARSETSLSFTQKGPSTATHPASILSTQGHSSLKKKQLKFSNSFDATEPSPSKGSVKFVLTTQGIEVISDIETIL